MVAARALAKLEHSRRALMRPIVETVVKSVETVVKSVETVVKSVGTGVKSVGTGVKRADRVDVKLPATAHLTAESGQPICSIALVSSLKVEIHGFSPPSWRILRIRLRRKPTRLGSAC
jgi:hypothetical protein